MERKSASFYDALFFVYPVMSMSPSKVWTLTLCSLSASSIAITPCPCTGAGDDIGWRRRSTAGPAPASDRREATLPFGLEAGPGSAFETLGVEEPVRRIAVEAERLPLVRRIAPEAERLPLVGGRGQAQGLAVPRPLQGARTSLTAAGEYGSVTRR